MPAGVGPWREGGRAGPVRGAGLAALACKSINMHKDARNKQKIDGICRLTQEICKHMQRNMKEYAKHMHIYARYAHICKKYAKTICINK